MTALVVLGVLGLTALFLAGLLTYLYRWRVRKRLFPQLPRLWKRDRSRFFISSALFAISLLAFMVVSLATGPSLPEPPQKLAAEKRQRPSFDGAPPPSIPQPAPTQTAESEPKAAQPSPQPVLPAITPKDPTELIAQSPQTAPSVPAVKHQPAAQTPAPIASSDKQPLSPQSSQESSAAQSSQLVQAHRGTETTQGVASAKAVEAPSKSAQPRVQPTSEPTQPQAEKKEAPPEAAGSRAAPTKQAAKPPETKEPAKSTAAQAKPKANLYTVCVASFKDHGTAKRQVTRLAGKGLKGKIMKVDLKGKGLWYRVCLGEFASSKQAAVKAKAWRDGDVVKTPFVVRLR